MPFTPFSLEVANGKATKQQLDEGINRIASELDASIGASAAGIEILPTVADMEDFFTDPVNQGRLVYVNNNNDDPIDPENGVYEYVDGNPRIAEGFYAGLSIVMQPFVDEASDQADRAEGAASSIADRLTTSLYPDLGHRFEIDGVTVAYFDAISGQFSPLAGMSVESLIDSLTEGVVRTEIISARRPDVVEYTTTADGYVRQLVTKWGEEVNFLITADTGGGSGLPPGGNPGALLSKYGSADGAADWEVSIEDAVWSARRAAIADIVGTPAPADHDGVTGNKVTFPQMALGRGASSHLMIVGTVEDSGAQTVLIYDRVTGELVERYVVRAVEAKDDHNACTVGALADGSFVAAACGHHTSNLLEFAVRRPNGDWTQTQLGFLGDLTYPCLFVDRDEKIWIVIRDTQTAWSIATKASIDAPWTTPKRVQSAAEQTYLQVRYDPVGHQITGFARPNSANPAFGDIRPVTLNCATGEFTDGNGGLGFLSGAASTNSKVLPFAYEDVAVLATPPEGRNYGVSDWSGDGKVLLVTSSNETDITDTEVMIWRLTGEDRFDINDYTVSDPFTNYGSRINNDAFNKYSPDCCLATEPHEGIRAYVCEKHGDEWQLRQWNNPSGDGETWTHEVLDSLDTSVSGNEDLAICRPMCFENATEKTPVTYCLFDNFYALNVYDSATIKFVRPDLA